MKLQKSNFVFILIMLVLLFVLSFLLWQRFDAELKQYTELQHTLMQHQATQTAQGIDVEISHIRNQMSAISLDGSWLSDIDLFENMPTVQESMFDRLKFYFPKMYAFSIASEKGEQLGGDIDFFIGDKCQADITKVASMYTPEVPYFNYEPYIHAKNGAYHFDVMIPVYIDEKKLVFFISFKASLLSKVLSNHIMFRTSNLPCSQRYSRFDRSDI
jgi:preprotein translocase subunit YajC